MKIKPPAPIAQGFLFNSPEPFLSPAVESFTGEGLGRWLLWGFVCFGWGLLSLFWTSVSCSVLSWIGRWRKTWNYSLSWAPCWSQAESEKKRIGERASEVWLRPYSWGLYWTHSVWGTSPLFHLLGTVFPFSFFFMTWSKCFRRIMPSVLLSGRAPAKAVSSLL